MPDALCLSNALGSGSGLGGASWMEIFKCVCVCQCVFIRWVFNVFLQDGGRVFFFFFFFRGRVNSVQCFFFSPLKGGEGTWGEISIVTQFVVCMFIFEIFEHFDVNFQPLHACITVHLQLFVWADLESCGHLKVYDVYSSIWGCVVLPLCSSQESPQQEGWCQGKLACLFYLPSLPLFSFASFPLYILGCPSTVRMLFVSRTAFVIP